ncbi:MAG: carbohydrate ABC transporter permease [Anaerolineae bacterium]|nr:carbohydrate ABC transporter permease [Anaerolineae bacterium]
MATTTRIMASPQIATPRRSIPWGTLITIGVLCLGAVLMIAPFLWIIQMAFGDAATAYQLPPRWWPANPTLDNFGGVFKQVHFELFILNSLKVAGAITLGQLITCSTAAYAFARLNFPGKNILFIILLSALMIPLQVTIVPLFILMRQLGLYNTHWALILPPLISPFGVFLLRQYFLTIPTELEDAARIDGAGTFTIFWRIILPLAGPALVTLAIVTFVYWWNDFLMPLIMINRPELQTLPVGLTLLRGRYSAGSMSIVAAGITMAIIPVLAVFLLLQRYIIKSIATTGIKG